MKTRRKSRIRKKYKTRKKGGVVWTNIFGTKRRKEEKEREEEEKKKK